MLQVQTASSEISSFVILLVVFLVFPIILGEVLYKKIPQRYVSRILVLLSVFSILVIAGCAIIKSSSLHSSAFIIIVIEGLFLFAVTVCFIIAMYSYKSIVVKQPKNR